jgi:Fe2+ or Zn2+ uptake regulation protein
MSIYDVCVNLIKKDYTFLKEVLDNDFIPKLTSDELYSLINIAIEQNEFAIQYACNEFIDITNEQRFNIELKCVKSNGFSLKFIEEYRQKVKQYLTIEQINEISLTAVKNHGESLEFVNNQTYEICFQAVRECGFALQYVKIGTDLTSNETKKICEEAVKNDGCALKFIDDRNLTASEIDDICYDAVRNDGAALQYVKNQTPEICLRAIKKDSRNKQYIKIDIENIKN